MRRNSATIRDVATEAGVSAATVSRFLNKSIVLPPETAARIERACKKLAYRPNQLAKRLSLGSSELIGLVTPEIANPFFAALAAAAEDEARRAGYSLIIMSTGGDPAVEIANVNRLDSRHIDGLIVLTNRPDDGRLREILTGRSDVVLLDEDVPGAEVGRIFVENEKGAYGATRHLIDAGHRRIAHIGGPQELFSARERFAGFARALKEAGIAIDPQLIRFGAYDRASGLGAIIELANGPAPTAVFTGSDYIAVGVLDGLRRMGLVAPRDFSIASFDDMPFADLMHPPLTTVRQPIEEMGRLGVRTLLAQIKGEATAGIARLPTELVIRLSVGPPPAVALSSARAKPEAAQKPRDSDRSTSGKKTPIQ
jgi:LacI family transcriptional regulator